MKRIIACIIVMPMLAFASLASALTCDEVTLSSAITDRFANAQDACLGVVEMNGETYVKMKVELTRPGATNKLTFKFKNQDGTFGPTHTINTPPEWRANIEGRNYRARELGRGQELDIYLPPDRWAAHIEASDVVVETFAPIAITEAEPEPEPEPMMLPATASNMPLVALFGGLALFAAGLIRVARRQAS
jgi:hypothetical protein